MQVVLLGAQPSATLAETLTVNCPQETNKPKDEASTAFAELDRFLQDNVIHLCFGLLLGVVVVMFLVATLMVSRLPVSVLLSRHIYQPRV
jgi:hypothetical protein